MRTDTGKAIHLADYRAPDHLIDTVALRVVLDGDQAVVECALSLRPNPAGRKDAPLVLDGEELNVRSVELDGKALSSAAASISPDGFTLLAPPQRPFELRTITQINAAANTQLSGLYKSGGVFCTQCEAEGFRRITYFIDRPDVLSVYTTRIEADCSQAPVLLGNGNRIESGELPGNRHFATWRDPFPKPCYLFALVGGDLASIHDTFTTMSGRQVALGLYVEKGKEARADYAMDALKRSMRWDEEVYGREYDLDVFNIVAVSDFNMGAMENKGLNIFNDKYILASPETATDADYTHIESVVAHEYFHNWTGNRITCRDWFQLCLKEGLTVFRDQEFSADQRSRAVRRIEDVRALRSAQFSEDAGPLAHNVRPETYHEINNFYTATVYQKGAEVIRMLKMLIGDEAFYRGMTLYFDRFDGAAATVEDFISCFAESSGRDLEQFMLWYRQSGTPRVLAEGEYDSAKQTYTLRLEQRLDPTPDQDKKQPQVIPVRLGLVGDGGRTVALRCPDSASRTGASQHELEIETFELNARSRTIVFSDIEERPTPSLFRAFSAPVKLETAYSEEDLLRLIAYDPDLFNRWQAAQTYAGNLLRQSVQRLRNGQNCADPAGYCDALIPVLADYANDCEFTAQILALPSETDIGRDIGANVDPDAIHEARQALRRAMGARHGQKLQSIYDALTPTPGVFDPAHSGERSLRNGALHLIAAADEPSGVALATAQLAAADTMTDKVAALSAIGAIDCHEREMAFAQFYREYADDHLVVDKWFALQAMIPGPQSLQRVEALMKHKAFSMSNPNRLRAVVATFAFANPTGFNASNGSGYAFVADVVRAVDPRNPQVAARLLTAFRNWRALEPDRKALAEQSLRELSKASNLSADVADILRRSLS